VSAYKIIMVDGCATRRPMRSLILFVSGNHFIALSDGGKNKERKVKKVKEKK